MSNGESLNAWVDESISNADENGPGAYVMAAVLADPMHCDGIRDKLLALRRGREPRLHWRSEDARRRTQIAAAIADTNLAAIVAVGRPTDPARQERARRCCLEQLLFDLHQIAVGQVWFETRTESLNRMDVQFFEALRACRVMTREMRADFSDPKIEPMLWLADAVAGAATASCRGESRWLDMIRPMVSVVEVRVR